jgi:N-acetyl-anhydromuramoyl-L-alanine amidase
VLQPEFKAQIDRETGLLEGINFIPSPNCDDRPDHCDVNLLVIHNISLPPGQFGGSAIEQLFSNTLDCSADAFYESLVGLQVSAHLLIKRPGDVIQFVPFHFRAWHAGKSSFQGRQSCNDFSIGIELEGTDEIPYTAEQYLRLSQIATQIMKYYPHITVERIVGHASIAPGRKTDPGPAFDWAHFYNLLEKEVQHETHHSVDLHRSSDLS